MKGGKPIRVTWSVVAILAAILVCAAFVRFYDLNWDSGQHLHPDERFITMVAVDRIRLDLPFDLSALTDVPRSPLNPRSEDPATLQPRNFAYGAFPLYATDAVSSVLSTATGDPWWDYDHITLLGRGLTALADVLSVLLLFLLGRLVRGNRTGLLAAGLYAFTAIAIQNAHFFTFDSWMTLFILASVYFALSATFNRRTSAYVLSGVFFGLAVASKSAALPFVSLFFVLTLYYTRDFRAKPTKAVAMTFLPLIAAGLAFFAADPYAVLGLPVYARDLAEQAAIARGSIDLPYTRQFVGTLPIIYQIQTAGIWGLGIPLLCTACAGLGLHVFWAITQRRRAVVLLTFITLVYLGFIFLFDAKHPRYLLPIAPLLVLFAAITLDDLWERLARILRSRLGWLRAGPVLAAVPAFTVVLGTILWASGFLSTYSGDHTRVEASNWIYENVPYGSVIGIEFWDDRVPLDLSSDRNARSAGYKFRWFSLFDDRDPVHQYAYIQSRIAQVDYIVISSPRIANGIRSLPWRYPVYNKYYELLFDGKLGFALTAEYDRNPSVLGVTFSDEAADESFSVYDHPRVYVFKKTASLASEDLHVLFAGELAKPWSPTRSYSTTANPAELQGDVGSLPVVPNYDWNTLANGNDGLAMIFWFVGIEALGLIALPFTWLVFPGLSDRGVIFAKLLGLLITTYLAWLLASLRVVPFTTNSVLLAAAVVAAMSVIVLISRHRQLFGTLRSRRGDILRSEVIFLAFFLAFVAIRFLNPDLYHPYYGGEKPMDLAFLNAILKSAYMPPYDPWYSDGYINYYYFGQQSIATLIKLTGIRVEVAYNLGLALFFAFTAGGAYSIGASIATRQRTKLTKWMSPTVIGMISALFVACLGNLHSIWDLYSQWAGLPRAMGEGFDFWSPSRVIPFTINEFPFFSFLYGDLHAHLLALPLTTAIAALALSIALTKIPIIHTATFGQSVMSSIPTIAIAGLLAGSLLATNTWSFPVALLVLGGGYLVRCLSTGSFGWLRLLGYWIAGAAAAAIAGWLLFLPFSQSYHAIYFGLGLVNQRTVLPLYLVVFGLFGFIGATYAVLSVKPLLEAGLGRSTIEQHGGHRERPCITTSRSFKQVATVFGTVSGAILFLFYWDSDWLLLVLLVALISILSVALFRQKASAAERFATYLLIAGLLITLGCEIFHLNDFMSGGPYERMNTVFKFYSQAWVLFGIGAAMLLPSVLSQMESRMVRLPWIGCLMVLFAVSLIYPLAATPTRILDRFNSAAPAFTLDGYQYMKTLTLYGGVGQAIRLAPDYEAIRWLRANVSGTPVILEASIGPYRGDSSRISAATGLPAVIGWSGHEMQQRGTPEVSNRYKDVREIYNTADPKRALELIKKYNVRYIYVGPIERSWTLTEGESDLGALGEKYASYEGLAKFDQMVGDSLEVAYRGSGATVYRVADRR